MSLPLKEPPGVLGKIVARTLRDVADREAACPVGTLHVHAGSRSRPFADALRGRSGAPSLIAEIKPRSPSRGQLADPNEVDGLLARAKVYEKHAAAISVLCDGPFFDGGLPLLQAVRGSVGTAVLCKDFIVTRYQVVEARSRGADAVLLMASLLTPAALSELVALTEELGLGALVEVHDEAELDEAIATPAAVVGVNSRDLKTLKIDLRHAIELLHHVPEDRVRVAESGIETAEDVQRVTGLADAVLVGTSLMQAADVDAKIRALGLGNDGPVGGST